MMGYDEGNEIDRLVNKLILMKSKYSLMIVLTAILMYYLMDIYFIIDTKFVVIQVERTRN